jgi:hypothetical protein
MYKRTTGATAAGAGDTERERERFDMEKTREKKTNGQRARVLARCRGRVEWTHVRPARAGSVIIILTMGQFLACAVRAERQAEVADAILVPLINAYDLSVRDLVRFGLTSRAHRATVCAFVRGLPARALNALLLSAQRHYHDERSFQWQFQEHVPVGAFLWALSNNPRYVTLEQVLDHGNYAASFWSPMRLGMYVIQYLATYEKADIFVVPIGLQWRSTAVAGQGRRLQWYPLLDAPLQDALERLRREQHAAAVAAEHALVVAFANTAQDTPFLPPGTIDSDIAEPLPKRRRLD